MVERMQTTAHSRATWIALLAVAIGMLGVWAATTVAQQSTNPQGQQGRKITLRDQLTAGLKARTKGDLAFIDTVVIAVGQGKLPRRLVDSTFLWARDRAARKSRSRRLRPMVYFQPALVLRAKRLGILL